MDKQAIISKYGKMSHLLERIGKLPLFKEPTLDDMELTKAEVQMVFRDLKKEDFEGSILEYLCYISTAFLVWFSKGKTAQEVAEFVVSNYEEHKEDANNLLRLIVKNYNYLYSEIRAEADEESFIKFARLWFKVYQKDYEKSIG